MVFDAKGNLYGTTNRYPSLGTIYKLTPMGNGKWTHTVLHTFTGGNDASPIGVVLDVKGNLYGTTDAGGDPAYQGEIFKLSPGAHGKWNETVLYQLQQQDGRINGNVTFDAAGNLYGTAVASDNFSHNTVYRLVPGAKGQWSYEVIHTFSDTDDPHGSVSFDSNGNLIGVTDGGPYAAGTVFKLTPRAKGEWPETTLYTFKSQTDGRYPNGSLIFDGAGNLYGSTIAGGKPNGCNGQGCGVAFKIAPR